MNLKDIIELAKQGYKPSDIKELIALSQEQEQEQEPEQKQEQEPEQKQEQEPEQKQEQDPEQKQEQDPEQKQEQDPEQKPENKPEDKDRIIGELRKKLKNENLSGEDKIKTSTEILNNLLKDM